MKKILLTLAAITALWTSSQAQTSGGPDLYGYVWRDSNDPNGPAYNWIDITTNGDASQVSGLDDDNVVGPFNFGFPFHFYWYDVNSFWIGSNGYVGFTNGLLASTASGFTSIPSTSQPQNYVAAFLADLNFVSYNGANQAQAWTWSSSDNDSLIVSFINVPFWANNNFSTTGVPDITGSNTFQIIFSAVDSSITFQYQSQTGASAATTNFFTAGIENNAGSDGLQHSHDVYPTSNLAVKFYRPATSTFQVNDASTSFVGNNESAGFFLSKDTAAANAYVMVAEVKNTGNTALNAFNVGANIKNQSNVNQPLIGGGNTTTYTTQALAQNQTEAVTFPKTWRHGTVGAFSFNVSTQLAGDATPTNNQRTCEIRVVDTSTISTRLGFDNGVASGNGIAWAGGSAGIGTEFPLPYFPCLLTHVHVYIASNATPAVGFYIKIYDNQGPNNGPGALLDSIFVDPSSVTTGAFNDIQLSSALTITTSSVYVGWLMGGAGIGIGQNTVAPFSNRMYEIFGSNWSPYRDKEIEDLMLNITIANPLNVGVQQNLPGNDKVGNFYPNPSNNTVSIRFTAEKANQRVDYKIYDMKGQMVAGSKFFTTAGEQNIQLPVSQLGSGLYTCMFDVNGKVVSRQFNIIK